MALAAAHITKCPYCIRGHTKAALRHGATGEAFRDTHRSSASQLNLRVEGSERVRYGLADVSVSAARWQ